MKRFNIVIAILFLTCGCQANVVQRGANRLTKTVPDLYQQQVLDNLAIAYADPSALPWFGLATQGTNTNTRQLSGNWTGILTSVTAAGLFFKDWILSSQNVGVTPTYLDSDAFQIAPVSDPDRLVWMQAAFQLAAGNGDEDMQTDLRNYNAIITMRLQGNGTPSSPNFEGCFPNYSDWLWDEPNTLAPWLGVAHKRKELPHGTCYVSRCCNSYIYVKPECHDAFRKFVLAILDIANANVDPVRITKTTTTQFRYRRDERNNPIGDPYEETGTVDIPMVTPRRSASPFPYPSAPNAGVLP